MVPPTEGRPVPANLAERYRVLLDIGRTLTGTLSPDELYHAIYRGTARVLEVAGFFISLYDARRDLATIVFFADRGVDRRVEITYRGSDSEVIRSGQAALVEDRADVQSVMVVGDEEGDVTPLRDLRPPPAQGRGRGGPEQPELPAARLWPRRPRAAPSDRGHRRRSARERALRGRARTAAQGGGADRGDRPRPGFLARSPGCAAEGDRRGAHRAARGRRDRVADRAGEARPGRRLCGESRAGRGDRVGAAGRAREAAAARAPAVRDLRPPGDPERAGGPAHAAPRRLRDRRPAGRRQRGRGHPRRGQLARGRLRGGRDPCAAAALESGLRGARERPPARQRPGALAHRSAHRAP